jgi:hypothetical protein
MTRKPSKGLQNINSLGPALELLPSLELKLLMNPFCFIIFSVLFVEQFVDHFKCKYV